MNKINLFDAVQAAAAPAPVAADIQRILDLISANAAECNRDAARETTVSVEFDRDNGDRFNLTLTGIAPFAVGRVTAPWTGAAAWGVLGQPSASHGNRPFARATAIEIGGCFSGTRIGFPLLSEAEASRLVAQIASLPAIRKVA